VILLGIVAIGAAAVVVTARGAPSPASAPSPLPSTSTFPVTSLLPPTTVSTAPPCAPPFTATSVPAGWDPVIRAGSSSDHPIVRAIGHWRGPERWSAVTIVGRSNGLVDDPVPAAIATFTSMGQPGRVVAIHEAYAAVVDPLNAPAGCERVYLIGEGVSVDDLRTIAAGLRTTNRPAVAELAVRGAAVRGSRVTLTATLPGWPVDGLAVEVSPPSGVGAAGVAQAAPIDDRTGSATFRLPSSVRYDGLCLDAAPCEVVVMPLGPTRVRFVHYDGADRRARTVAEGWIEVVAARRGVPYDAQLEADGCGPLRAELDGRTWVAADPEQFGDLSVGAIDGTMTITGATTASFRSAGGTSGTLRRSAVGFAC
jgi:hypothetical protein